MAENIDTFSCVVMSEFNSASLTSSFQLINSTGLTNSVKILVIANSSSNWVLISFDGANLSDMIPPNTRVAIDLQANHACNSAYSSGTLNGRKFQAVYAKGTASAGSIGVGGYR